MEFQAPGYGLVLPWLLQPLGGVNQYKEDLSLALPHFPALVSLLLSQYNSTFQLNKSFKQKFQLL